MPGDTDHSTTDLDGVQMPEDADALYAQGMAHYRRREWEEAKACFVRLKAIAPDRRGVDALLNEVDIFIQLQAMQPEQEEASAIEGAEEEAQSAEVAIPQEEAPGERASGRRLSWPAIVIIFLAILTVAFLALYTAGALDTLMGNHRQAQVRVLLNQGRAAMNVGDYDRAVEAFGEALALMPDNEDIKTWYAKARRFQHLASLYTQAEADIKAGQWDSALEKLNEIVAIDPTYKNVSEKVEFVKSQQTLDARFAEAKEYFDQGNWSEAIRILEQLQEQAPAFKADEVKHTLFYAYFRDGVELMASAGDSLDVVGQAIQSFNRALAILPDSQEALEERQLADLYRQGYLFFKQENWPKAVLALKQIYDLRPNYMDGRVASMLCSAYLQLGDSYYAADDLEQALQQYRNVLDIESCDHVEAAMKERQVYATLYPPTPTPTRTPTLTSTPTPTATWTATPLPPPPTSPPRATPTPLR